MNFLPMLFDFSAIETEYILTKIILKVFRFKTPLNGSKHKPFNQRNNQMNAV